VEHPHAELKMGQNFKRVRYCGMAANRCDIFLHGIAYNLRRAVFILKEQVRKVLETMKAELSPSMAREQYV
jgi:hypothetical protein